MAASGTMKDSPQGGSFQISFSSGPLTLKCLVSSVIDELPVNLWEAAKGHNNGLWHLVSLLDYPNQQLTKGLLMPAVKVSVRWLLTLGGESIVTPDRKISIYNIYTQTYMSSVFFFKFPFLSFALYFSPSLHMPASSRFSPFPSQIIWCLLSPSPSLSHIPSHPSSVPFNIPGLCWYCRISLRSEDLVPQASDTENRWHLSFWICDTSPSMVFFSSIYLPG